MFRTEVCPICQKTFIPAAEHLYKLRKNNKVILYCSYSCWLKDGGENGRKYKKQ